jgi:hypothetical protein
MACVGAVYPDLEYEVDVDRLLVAPAVALHPVLTSLEGWEKVRQALFCSMWKASSGSGCNLKPCLSQATPEDLEVSQISGAMTNLVYRCRLRRTQKVRSLAVVLAWGLVQLELIGNCSSRPVMLQMLCTILYNISRIFNVMMITPNMCCVAYAACPCPCFWGQRHALRQKERASNFRCPS